MRYRYSRHHIAELVNAPKVCAEGQTLKLDRHGEKGLKCGFNLDLLDGPYCDLRFFSRAGRSESPETYEAALLLDQQRVRGVGYNPVGRQNFRAKLRIPAGWHQNICDPNLPTNHPEWNRHEPLPAFAPVDFLDFTRQTAGLWHIDTGTEMSEMLL